jgi:hypothetical protein
METRSKDPPKANTTSAAAPSKKQPKKKKGKGKGRDHTYRGKKNVPKRICEPGSLHSFPIEIEVHTGDVRQVHLQINLLPIFIPRIQRC